VTPKPTHAQFAPSMASIDPSDGSEDVADFLRRIRELGEQRDKEDAERTRKLEEEIMEGRRQREVRRAGETNYPIESQYLFMLAITRLTILIYCRTRQVPLTREAIAGQHTAVTSRSQSRSQT